MGYKTFPRTDWKSYMDIIAASKFVFCPRGNGIDTHRFWETYAANSIPIILDEYYIERDFPDATVLVVKDVSLLTPEFLEENIANCRQITITTKNTYRLIIGNNKLRRIISFFVFVFEKNATILDATTN